MKTRILPAVLLSAALSAFADTPPSNGGTWVDARRDGIKNTLDRWAHNMDDWFGEPDPDRPASANLRVMLDNRWNKHDGYSLEPRIRGRVKLPVLQRKLNVVFGDDSIDDELSQEAQLYRPEYVPADKTFDGSRTRESNSSVALRWSDRIEEAAGIQTDADIGIRSGDDLYTRVKIAKNWQLSDTASTRVEQIYRYGLDSKHYARTNWEIRRGEAGKPFIANELHVQYARKDSDDWSWGDSAYRQHDFSGHKRLNYGLHAGGKIENRKASLNSYGPFASWRQPVWRDWLFAQAEVNYLNDKEKNRSHHIGTLVRMEALF